MINDDVRSILTKMALAIDDATTQLEHIVATLAEPDVCAECEHYDEAISTVREQWFCTLAKSPFFSFYFKSVAADELSCIHFERREAEK